MNVINDDIDEDRTVSNLSIGDLFLYLEENAGNTDRVYMSTGVDNFGVTRCVNLTDGTMRGFGNTCKVVSVLGELHITKNL